MFLTASLMQCAFPWCDWSARETEKKYRKQFRGQDFFGPSNLKSFQSKCKTSLFLSSALSLSPSSSAVIIIISCAIFIKSNFHAVALLPCCPVTFSIFLFFLKIYVLAKLCHLLCKAVYSIFIQLGGQWASTLIFLLQLFSFFPSLFFLFSADQICSSLSLPVFAYSAHQICSSFSFCVLASSSVDQTFFLSKYFPPFPYSKSFTGFAPLCSCHRYHFSGNNFTVKSNFPRNPTGQEVPGKPKGSHNGSLSLSKQLNNLCCFLFLSKNTYHLILLQSLQSPAVYSLLSPRKGTWENVFMVERR